MNKKKLKYQKPRIKTTKIKANLYFNQQRFNESIDNLINPGWHNQLANSCFTDTTFYCCS